MEIGDLGDLDLVRVEKWRVCLSVGLCAVVGYFSSREII